MKHFPLGILVLLLIPTVVTAGVIGDVLTIGQVVSPNQSTPCFSCSTSGRYVVSSVISQTTTTIRLASFADFNYYSTLKNKGLTGTIDYIDVYRYEGPELARNFSTNNYSFSVTRYGVFALESYYKKPAEDVAGVANAQRLSAIQSQISSSLFVDKLVYKNISSVRSQTSDNGSFSKIVSFFVGSLSSIAFVLAVRKRI